MSNEGGPWGHRNPEPEAPPPPAPRPPVFAPRPISWPAVVLVAGICGLVLALARGFPEARLRGQDWGDAVYLGAFALLVGAGLWRVRGLRLVFVLRYVAIWVAVAAVLALGFAYKDEIVGVPQRLAIAFGTGRPVSVGSHELVISQDAEGSYEVVGRVNGQSVRFMVDTGASETVLAPEDARRLGVDFGALTFDEQAETANGKGYGARYVAREFEVGPIRLTDFRMQINKAPMSSSLLGQTFLNRLASFEIRDRKLYLKWRD
jgi:aspartyl protease family protein